MINKQKRKNLLNELKKKEKIKKEKGRQKYGSVEKSALNKTSEE